jgi:hypothetical protein
MFQMDVFFLMMYGIPAVVKKLSTAGDNGSSWRICDFAMPRFAFFLCHWDTNINRTP